MATVAPNSIWGIYALIRPFFKTSDIKGGVANDSNNSGYHVSRETLLSEGRSGDYSVKVVEDKRGPARNASGIDITLNAAEMKLIHNRLLAAARANDPRLLPIREFYGTNDGANVTGWNTRVTGRNPLGYLKGPRASDASHLWHEHVGILREYSGDLNAARGIAEVMAGVAPGTFGWKPSDGPVVPPPVKLPTHYVTSLVLWGIKHETGKATKRREWGFAITTPDQVIELEGRSWLLTEAGYRYDMKFLSTSKPTKRPTPPPPAPVTTLSEKVLTINTRKANVPSPPSLAWSARRGACVAAIKHTKATLIGAQECRPNQRVELAADLGMKTYHKGNVVLFYAPSVWEISDAKGYDLKTGDDDRWLIAATFKHKETGKIVRAGNTHLTNLEPPTGGNDDWRAGQLREIVKLEPKLDVLFGDFNSSKLVYDLAAQLAGLEEFRRKAPADKVKNRAKNTTHHYKASGTSSDGRWIDNVLTSKRVRVVSCSVLLLDSKSEFKNASDHNGVAGRIEL